MEELARRVASRVRERLDERAAGFGGKELPMPEATVPVGAIGVKDLQLDVPARRAVSVLRHEHFDALPDDLTAESDPGAPCQLETQPARFDERPVEGAAEIGGLEDDDERPGSPGECRQPADRLGALTSSSTTVASPAVA